jgi:ferrochelatase
MPSPQKRFTRTTAKPIALPTQPQAPHYGLSPAALAAPKKVGVLLLNMGGPNNLEAVQPFLYNLFADNDIVQLPAPPWLQRLFAWRVSHKRKKEAQHNYGAIGGRSPIEPLSRQQATLLQHALAPLFEERCWPTPTCYLAMRYWHPRLSEVLPQLMRDGIEQLVVLPLYPHYCLATTGSSLRELNEELAKPQYAPWKETLQIATVCSFYDEPLYIKAVAETIERGLAQHPFSCPPQQVHLVFSAHGIPVNYGKTNRDPYLRQVQASIEAVMSQHFPQHSFQLCFQSRVGPMRWLEPYTQDLLVQLAKEGRDNVLVVPISFVSDHIETLSELDLEYIPMAHAAGMAHCHRAPALNDSPLFVEALRTLVLRAVEDPTLCRVRLPQLQAETLAPVEANLPAGLLRACSSATHRGQAGG